MTTTPFKQSDYKSNVNQTDGKLHVIADIGQGTSANDAFGRLRVSEPYTIFDSKLVADKQPLFYDDVTNGTGTSTFNSGEASVSMAVSANNDYVIRQTFMSFNYQPGKAQYILCTGVIGEPTASTESRIGYFNTFGASAPYTSNRDGLYFGQDGTNKYVAISKNGTENKILQSSWNVDKLNGTGKSGVTIDWNQNQIFFIDFEWLGVGIVRFGHVVDGAFIVCHIESHVNDSAVATGAYMSTPNHSIRYEVRSTGGSLTMKQICSSVMSEGGIEPSGVTRTVGNEVTSVSISTTLTGLLYLRLNSAKPCTTIQIADFGVLNTANNTGNYQYKLILNPTIGGTAPVYFNVTNSAIDFAVGVANNAITGGTELLSGYASGNSPQITVPTELLIRNGIAVDGTQDVIALCVRTLSGTDTFLGYKNIRELTCG